MRIIGLILVVGAVVLGVVGAFGHATVNAQEGVTRNVLLKQELEADPGKEVTLFVADYKLAYPVP